MSVGSSVGGRGGGDDDGSAHACRTKIKCRDIVEAHVFASEWSVGNSTKEKYRRVRMRTRSSIFAIARRAFFSHGREVQKEILQSTALPLS